MRSSTLLTGFLLLIASPAQAGGWFTCQVLDSRSDMDKTVFTLAVESPTDEMGEWHADMKKRFVEWVPTAYKIRGEYFTGRYCDILPKGPATWSGTEINLVTVEDVFEHQEGLETGSYYNYDFVRVRPKGRGFTK